MLILFEESRAARECRAYAAERGFTVAQTKELLDRAYHLGTKSVNYGPWDEALWVKMALKDDGHKTVSLVSMFAWGGTDEGVGFWVRVHISYKGV